MLVRLVGNALPLVLTLMLKKRRTLHVYGHVILNSQYCNDCHQEAFVIQGRFACCGKRAKPEEEYRFKIEIDKVGARRKQPNRKAQQAMLLAQNNCCYYCGDEFGTYRRLCGTLKFVKIHWDHFVPFSYDGNNHSFVAACAECNMHKSALMFGDLEEARTYLKTKINEKKTATRKA